MKFCFPAPPIYTESLVCPSIRNADVAIPKHLRLTNSLFFSNLFVSKSLKVIVHTEFLNYTKSKLDQPFLCQTR